MNVNLHLNGLAHGYRFLYYFLNRENGCSEGEARAGAYKLRSEVEDYGITFGTCAALAHLPFDPAVEQQARKFWKEQDKQTKKERKEQENAWKYNPDVRPEGEGWFWVRSHQRVSCRGKAYTVRGHWRCRKPKQAEIRNAA